MIYLTRPYFDDDEIKEIKAALDSGWVAGQGPKNKEFSRMFSDYIGCKHAIPVSNCTTALHLALLSLGIKTHDEVIVSDYTFPATGHSVLYVGAKPRFIDIIPDTFNMNPELLTEMISKKTKAIIVVHTFGSPAELNSIIKIADENDLYVIEDAACAAGSEYSGTKIGNFGDLSCFSFHARKNVTTGEGGLVTTDNTELAKKIDSLACFGMESAYSRQNADEISIPTFTELGYNYKLSDLAAAIGIAQMRKIEMILKLKHEKAIIYDDLLSPNPKICPQVILDNSSSSYQSYVVKVPSRNIRDKIIIELRKKGIQSQIGTYSSYIQPVYHSADECPISRDIYECALSLPFYATISPDDIALVCKELEKIV